jgi:predicted ATPase/signal transduction histidine kinase/tRNA A-37 threonylcarbamoyl transferase component Bud32
MVRVLGYALEEEIHTTSRSIVYRARRESDGKAVILKVLDDEYPSVEAIARFRREYEIGRSLAGQGTVVYAALEPVGTSFAIVMEDVGGSALRGVLDARRLELGEAIAMGAALARAIAGLHRARVMHRDVNPSNALVVGGVGSSEAALIDFGLATSLPRETARPKSPTVLEGTLAYISPEQTGRMNRVVDYRTDLYSLGVTLYEMLTGKLPFETTDAVELVHLHIAQRPTPPHEVDARVPRSVSAIVMKLLAKMAEDRYQSAVGVALDLEACLAGPSDDFVIGARDVSEELTIPERLYGREREITTLMALFDRAARGRAQLMLVGGYAGVGKSALVHEIHKPVLARRGYFASGKFDLLQRDIPYGAFLLALGDLVRQLLTESEERLERWRRRLREALGDAGRVVVDVVPSLEVIVGWQPPVPPLSPAEAQSRFNFVFQQLLGALAAEEHPLVLFLDDLQWADLPSLKLLESLLVESGLCHVLIIGAYRDNEVSAVHPLSTLRAALEKAHAPTETIALPPLDAAHVDALVADTLRCDPVRSSELARLVYERTGGNPFFLGQLLRALHDDGLIRFAPSHPSAPRSSAGHPSAPRSYAGLGAFVWDIDGIRVAPKHLTNDVVELMTRKIDALPAGAREVLEIAACVGNRFDLHTLSIALQRTALEVAADLYPALEEGLVLPLDDRFRLVPQGGADDAAYAFLHDRVQQAANARVPEPARAPLHRKVARLLFAGTPKDRVEERIFDLVHHFNLGGFEGLDDAQRYEVARLDLVAGRRAKASAAFEPALRCFSAGCRFLPDGAENEAYDLWFPLHAEAAEAQYLNGQLEAGHLASEALLAKAKTALEKVLIHETRATAAMTEGALARAKEEGYRAMELLGVDLPRTMELPGFFEVLAATENQIGPRTASDLLELAATKDARCLAAARVALMLVPGLFMENPVLCLAMQLGQVRLALEHGNAPETAYYYLGYALVLSNFRGDVEKAASYANMAIALLDRRGDERLRAKVQMVATAFILHHKMHLHETVPLLVECVHAGMEHGDREYTGYSATHACTHLFFAGEPLDVVLREHDRYLELLERWRLSISATPLRIMRHAALRLAGRDVGGFDDEKELPGLLAEKNYSTISQLYVQKTMLAYLFRDAEGAVKVAEAAEPFTPAQVGLVSPAIHTFYQTLAILDLLGSEANDDVERLEAGRAKYLEKVDKNLADIERWAKHAPSNWQHRHELALAERARVTGDTLAAAGLYDRAAEHAAVCRFVQDEALAHELAGEFYLSLGRGRIARDSLLLAAGAYRRWGAEGKVQDLERRHASVFTAGVRKTLPSPDRSVLTSSSSHAARAAMLDLSTVLKAALAISGEIVLERLLENLMRIAIENAGAQRGFLILDKGGALSVEAGRAIDGEPMPTFPVAVDATGALSSAIVTYVARTGESVIENDAAEEGHFHDAYVERQRPRSVLCVPLVNQGRLVAIVYLENNLAAGAFTEDRVEVLRLLSAQAALSIQNAVLYATLEEKVEERTRELQAKNEELGRTLTQLRETQKQLVMQEKLASLGALVAGIAHEMKNPLNFVNNFAELTTGLAEEIAATISSQRERLDPVSAAELVEALGMLRNNVVKINEHGRRANGIIDGMLFHARDSAGRYEPADLNGVVAESLHLAQHGARGGGPDLQLAVEASYDAAIGPVEMAAGDLSRAFINVIVNALYAIREKRRVRGESYAPRLTVSTKDLGDRALVLIRDNGTGVARTILGKVYDPFFTTKPPGEGTGLGLSISHDIVVGAHRGTMTLDSAEGEWTEMTIAIPKRAARS